MKKANFFKKAEHYLIQNKAFVLYRKPSLGSEKTYQVQGFFQENDTLHLVNDYQESGFVMAPFQLTDKVIIIPRDQAEYDSTEIPVQTNNQQKVFSHKEIGTTEEKEQHLALVAKGIEAIQQGTFQKVVLSRTTQVATSKSPIVIFKELLQAYPTAFVSCWFHPKVGLWLGATPETLVFISGTRIQTMAVAGTKPVEENKPPQWTSKEIEEQQIVTNAIETALDQNVSKLIIGKTHNHQAGNLWHLKTDISGTIKPSKKPVLKNIIENLHPTPAVCGLPKERARKFILENEQYDRKFYSGFLGELNLKTKTTRSSNRRNQENQAYGVIKNETHLFVNLRCMQLTDQIAKLYIGGGIVKNSNPESEWQETQHKSKTMLKVL